MSDSFVTLWTVTFQALLSMRFPRQEYWSDLPFPSPGELPHQRISLPSPAFIGGFFITEKPRSPIECSVQFSHSVVSDSLWPHEWQQARSPCPSPTAGVHSDSHPSRQWCHPAISSSVVPFSSCPQSLPASESFPTPQFKSINFSVLSFLYSPTLTSIHDHWKNHSLD